MKLLKFQQQQQQKNKNKNRCVTAGKRFASSEMHFPATWRPKFHKFSRLGALSEIVN